MRAYREEKGTALVLALGYLGVCTLLASAFVAMLHQSIRAQQRAEVQRVGLHVAEAGIEKAVAELRANPAYAGETGSPLGDGRFNVEVARKGTAGEYQIVSTGKVREDSQSRVVVDIVLGTGGAVRELRWAEEHSR